MDTLDSLVDSRTGVPNDPKMARLVMAAKYVLAHKGILLEREKLHLSSMGFSAEELVEVLHSVLEPRVDGVEGGRRSDSPVITRRSPSPSARWRA